MNKFVFVLFVLLNVTIVANAQTGHTCPSCNGSGKSIEQCSNCNNGAVYCTQCNYSGKISQTCMSCNGRGYKVDTKQKVCTVCNGQRYVRATKEVPCSCRGGKVPKTTAQGTVYVPCSRCSGKGYLTQYYNASCSYCGGSGYSGTETVQQNCYACGGSGQKVTTCSKCNGRGAYACPKCHGYANVTSTCKRCSGYGVIYAN